MFIYQLVLICRSIDCFRLGWPMRDDADFFCQPENQLRAQKNGVSTPSVPVLNDLRCFWDASNYVTYCISHP